MSDIVKNQRVQVKTVNVDGRTYSLPEFMRFEGLDPAPAVWSWDVVGFVKPLKGQWFVSGSDPMAYRAYADMTDSYLVVYPKNRGRKVVMWVEEEE